VILIDYWIIDFVIMYPAQAENPVRIVPHNISTKVIIIGQFFTVE
jgi:hypothetical protein